MDNVIELTRSLRQLSICSQSCDLCIASIQTKVSI